MENKLIYQAISSIMQEIGTIKKERKNNHQGFKFRGIDDVYNAIHPLLAKYKIFSVPEIVDSLHEERKTKSGGLSIYRIYKIKYTLYAADGSNVSGVVIGEGMDSGDKAGNKAMSIAHKYFYLQLFSIPTELNDDPDYDTPEESEKIEDTRNIDNRLEEIMKDDCFSDIEREKFQEWKKIKSTMDDKIKKLNQVQNILEKRKKEVF